MKFVSLLLSCLLVAVNLAEDGGRNVVDEDGDVEVEDAEGVLQQLDEALENGIITSEDLAHTLKNTFKLTERQWRAVVHQHDADGDGKLAADELLNAAEYLTEKQGEWPIEEKRPVGPWIGICATVGVILLYVLYSGWRTHRERNNARVPDERELRAARLAAFGRSPETQRTGVQVDNTNQSAQHSVTRKDESSTDGLRRRPLVEHESENFQSENNRIEESESDLPEEEEDPLFDNHLEVNTLASSDVSDSEMSLSKKLCKKQEMEAAPAHPKLTGEDLLLYVFSKIFNLKMELQKLGTKAGWLPGTMSIKTTDLPTKIEEIHLKTLVLFEKRLSRHFSSKVKLCVSCYYNSLELKGAYQDETVEKILSTMTSLCVSTILQQLQEEEEEAANEEDDLYSDLGHSAESAEKLEVVSFLSRVAGWSEDGINISPELLGDILAHAATSDRATQAMINVLSSAGNVLKSVPRLDELQLLHGKTIKGLEQLLMQPAMSELLAKVLDKEIHLASGALGVFFQKQSVLGSLLSITTIPPSLMEGIALKSPSLQPWVSLRGFPERPHADEVKNLQTRMQDQLHNIQGSLFRVLKRMMKLHRETALAWLATLISMNEMRTSVTPQIHPVTANSAQATCSDGFMLNLCAVLIELCLPFCKGDLTKLQKIDPSYSVSPACRLNYDFETCLAGGQIVQEGEQSSKVAAALQGKYNFMTEILHLTARAMNVGFLPAKVHFGKLQQDFMHSIKAAAGNTTAEADLKAKQTAFSFQWDTHLLDPHFLRNGSEFYLTVALWLQMQLDKAAKGAANEEIAEKNQRKVFAQVPEHIVKDMAQWFWFIASHGLVFHPRALAGLQLVPFVDLCVYLLRRPDLVPGPIPAYRITQALLAFVATTKRQSAHQRGWGSGVISEMAAMVHACPTVQEHLGPALVHNYISVDVVEGLDVDKEDFDKYGARAEIARLLQNLWHRLDCRSSVIKLCGTEKFQAFLGAILDTLLYQLHDSLARLANVKKLEISHGDEASWNALSAKERDASEKFLKHEERIATGFMSMARETLGLIDLISKSAEVARSFTAMPLAKRAASTFIGFLESLCGAKSSEFKVKDMEKYRFNPRELLSQIVQIILRIVCEEQSKDLHFVNSLACDPDYSSEVMQKACDILLSKNILDESVVKEFALLNEGVSSTRREAETQPSFSTPADNEDWQASVDSLRVDESTLEKSYTETMGDLRFDSAELQDNHCYQSQATHPMDARSRQASALMKEMKQWSEILPIHPHAAVFIRQDEERMDMVRALVTGTNDTPYSLGCFVFDIYFPSQYPNVPPLVKFKTTGNGTVRFNPNLYADGKVCLSLLGTFYSGDSSQKWQPNTSSLYQVLVSIQSMILISDPMYNEPGYEGMRDTQEGEARSREYNARLRLMTVRHAMLEQLKNPPVGCEEIIKEHFRLQRNVVLKQCSDWLRESEAGDEERKLRRVIDELRVELNKLTTSENDTAGE